MADQDKNLSSFAGIRDLTLEGQSFNTGEDSSFDDCLKFSNTNAVVRNCTAAGGRENACDINNRSIVFVEGCLALAGGAESGMVIKGGSMLWMGAGSKVWFTPAATSTCDLEVDGFSDQVKTPSTVEGRFYRTDGKPVRVVFGRFRRPKINSPHTILWGKTIAYHAYNLIKDFARLITGKKPGEKGPF